MDADRGKAMKVRVSFTDDSGNSEELTSEATAAVAPRPPLTASFESVPDSHDGNNTFTFEVRFSEEIYIGYKRLRDYVFTVTAGDVIGVRRLNPPSNTGWEIIVEPDGDGEVTIALPATKFCSRASAICTENRKKLSNSSTVTVPGPATQSQQAQVENSPATGLPVITGTATVGETLSVSMADVSDSNGLTGASHSHQWMADDVDIQGATGATYTLADGDEGKAIKVQVSFTDDDGFSENVTSAATAAVSAAPAAANSSATGLPTITGTAQVEQTLTADTSAIADEDGLSNVSYDYQWMAGGSDIDGATGSSYTVITEDVGKALKVRVTFDDDAGNQEILTSSATAPVRAPLTPFTAEFRNVPDHHNGATAFKFELYFNKVAVTSWRTVANDILEVSGGEVTKASRLDPNGADRNKRWEVTVKPARAGDVTITLPVRDCAGANAVCANEQPLARAVSATVARQEALTARTSQVSGRHDGNNSFTFELHFSEEFYLSYRELRDYAFTVTGGEVVKARRLNPPSSIGWEITVQPAGDEAVTIVLPIPTHCAPAGAICTADDRKLSNRLELTVSGP